MHAIMEEKQLYPMHICPILDEYEWGSEEFKLATLQGKFLPREQIAGEMAARAVALRDGLKNAMESAAGDIVEIVAGDPKQTAALVEYMATMFDRALGEYARPLDLVIEFAGIEAGTEEDNG